MLPLTGSQRRAAQTLTGTHTLPRRTSRSDEMVIKNEKGLFQKYLEWETVADFLSSLKFKYENRNGNFKENKQNKLGLH